MFVPVCHPEGESLLAKALDGSVEPNVVEGSSDVQAHRRCGEPMEVCFLDVVGDLGKCGVAVAVWDEGVLVGAEVDFLEGGGFQSPHDDFFPGL